MNFTGWDPLLPQVLLSATLKTTVLLGVVGGVALVWRGAAARGRQLLWALGLVGAVALPIFSPMLPDLHLPLFSWPAESSPAAMTHGRPTPQPAVTTPDTVTRATQRAAPSALALATSARPGTPREPLVEGAASVPTPTQPLWPILLAGVWLSGFALLLVRWLVGQLKVGAMARRSTTIRDPSWLSLLEHCQWQVGLSRSVSLRSHCSAATPMTWGLLRPVILLPSAADGWSEERRRVVLLHELVHVRRGDWLLRSAAQLASAVYWFHPLVWLGLRRLTVEQEQACDDAVLTLGTSPSRYADHLLAIARAAARSPIPLPAVEMAGRTSMENRLMSILSFPRRRAQSRRPVVAALLLTAALIPVLGAVRIWAAPATTEAKTPAPTPAVAPMPDAPPVPSVAPIAMVAPMPDAAPLPSPMATVAPAPRAVVSPAAPMPAPEAAPAPGPVPAPELAPSPDAQGNLAAVAAELKALESRLRPYEAQLEALSAQLDPLAALATETSERHRPYEQEMAAIQRKLQPYLEQVEAAGRELQPLEGRMEELSALMHPYEELVRQVQLTVQPGEEGLEKLMLEIEPYHRQLAEQGKAMALQARELEAARRQHREAIQHANAEATAKLKHAHQAHLEQLSREMEERSRRMQAVNEELEPFNLKMRALAQQMQPSHEEMEALSKELEPLHRKIEALHREMEPALKTITHNHEAMEALHKEMEKMHLNMEPLHQEMEKMHFKLQPVHEEMQRLHEQLEPLHREMEKVHKKLHREVRGSVRAILEDEFAGLQVGSQPLDQATVRIMKEISFHKSDSHLSVRAPAARLRHELSSALGGASSGNEVKAAIERAARAISNLEILY